MKRILRFRMLGFLALALIAGSCMSPLDPDTPRNRYIDGGTDTQLPGDQRRFHPSHVNIIIKDGPEFRLYKITDTSATVDTTADVPVFWLHAAGAWAGRAPKGTKVVSSFILRLDSVLADGVSRMLAGNPRGGSGMLFVIGKVVDSTLVEPLDTLIAEPGKTPVSMRFQPTPRRLELEGAINAGIGQPRLDFNAFINIVY